MKTFWRFEVLLTWTIPCILLTTSYQLYENRLATFPKPDFNTSFVFRSQRGAKSFREIQHGLGKEPFYVRVYAKAISGRNQGFCFNGVGVNQVDPAHTSYGGLIYAYNSLSIRVWAPSKPSGHIIFVKDGWGGEKSSQQMDKALVIIEMWSSGPEPNFQIDTVIGNGTNRGSYGEVDHQLRQIPDRVLVRVSPESDSNTEHNPNGGFWFHAVSSVQNSNTLGNYGGVIFAFNERIIRLWAPDINVNNTGCILIDSAWGGGLYSQRETRCRIHVKVWINLLPLPSSRTDWFDFQAQRGPSSFKDIAHNLNSLPELVVVQARALEGMNYHFIFEAQGSIQSDDNSNSSYGGIIFAYDANHVRLWAPSQNDGFKNGYGLLIKKGWGDDRFLQDGAINVQVRVLVYASKCKTLMTTTMENNTCIQTGYETYGWVTSSWSKCSSICNKGLQNRHSTGCQVTSKQLIPSGSCDFEKDMCGWTTSSLTKLLMIWKRTNGTTPTPNSGPMWGHPKGSYYVYTYSQDVVPEGKGILESPTISGASRCHLSFFWSLYGSDIGELTVEVSVWDNWKQTGWGMTGSQGPIYWRAAYIDLEKFPKIYRIRFVHILPKHPYYCDKCPKCAECKVCPGGSCPLGNVAIDDVQLWCEASHNVTSTTECKSRSAIHAGCEQAAVVKDVLERGPAYSEEVVRYGGNRGTKTFVKSDGFKNDLIAVYSVHVYFKAEYSLWMSVYSTNYSNSYVSFRINQGDWHVMMTAQKSSHPLWLNYRAKTFLLHPGVHTVAFRQIVLNFRFDRIALSPTKLTSWQDLGMQSRHIPDSYLTAFPSKNSNPLPRFGRLNAADAWCSTDFNENYVNFQVKLPSLAILSRVAIQGGKDLYQKSNEYWLKSFRMKVSIDNGDKKHFTWYRDRAGRMIFSANNDSFNVVENELPFAVPVRAVRIYPKDFENWICMRIELYGFYLSSSACATAGPELATTKPCAGDKDCGNNAKCRAEDSTGLRKKIGNLWQQFFTGNNSTPEHCTCLPGHHGASCQHYGCNPNPCFNNATCRQTSTNGSFSCLCLPGFHGNICQMSCPAGRYGYNCSKQCLCSEHGSCDEATGHCYCAQGFNGTYCQHKCRDGYYGYNCAQRCQCENGAECDKETGACNCSLGWTGKLCNQQCPWNLWGEGCRLNCSCSISALMCNRKTGECLCGRGHFGRYCEHKCPHGTYGWNCTQTCQCDSNSTCSRKDGSCKCTQPGTTGILCKQPCPYGYYGNGCQHRCLCKNQADCDPVTGQCTCPSGWRGKVCDTPCPQGLWGHNCSFACSCVNGAKCDPVIGQCSCLVSDCTCDPGWTGTACGVPCSSGKWGANCSKPCVCTKNSSSVCNSVNGACCNTSNHGNNCSSSCPTGTYGPNCQSKCQCLNDARCDHVTGQCYCPSGWMGSTCGVKCSSGYFGTNCSARCLCKSCEPSTGACNCPPGWQGLACTQPCPLGYYGNSCSQQCTCAHNSTCSHVDGACICSPGWRGADCSTPCASGRFGMRCSSPCNCGANVTESSRPCHPVTGSCNCKPGFQGLRCLEQCPPGYYGKNCIHKCSCLNGAVCNFADGGCICRPGYHGTFCGMTCPRGVYGIDCNNSCQCISAHTDVCSKYDGTCSCSDGYTGVLCENRCPETKYGAGCHGSCKCKNKAHCDHVSGRCLCPAGYQGNDCGAICEEGTFGAGCKDKCLCMNGAACNRFTGDCICAPGYSGYRCTDACLEGRFGVNCLNICDCNPSNTKTCDHKDGTCHCMLGYIHRRCDQACKDGSYGPDCRMTCPRCSRHVSAPCNKQHGNCTCTPGYHGYQCYDDCPLNAFGLGCREQCVCSKGLLCHQEDGSCLVYGHGVFALVVEDTIDMFNDVDRLRDMKIGIEEIMDKYYDMYYSSPKVMSIHIGSQVKQDSSTKSPSRPLEAPMETSLNQSTPSRVSSPRRHDFVVRVLEIEPVYLSKAVQGTRVQCVLLDNHTVVNSTAVLAVLQRVSPREISTDISAEYYTGELYNPTKPSVFKVHLPLIIGASVGILLVIAILVIFKLRYRYRVRRGSPGYRKAKKENSEFELVPCIGHGNSHLLAFDNPYYDVLAAMGIDDDVEEDYSNPLYDDVSMCSDSYNSSTDDSCHKGSLSHMVIR